MRRRLITVVVVILVVAVVVGAAVVIGAPEAVSVIVVASGDEDPSVVAVRVSLRAIGRPPRRVSSDWLRSTPLTISALLSRGAPPRGGRGKNG